MVEPIRALLVEMADELDHNRRCLLDDASLTDPLADRARAVLAAAQGEAEGREPASVAEQPSDEELLRLMPEQFRADLATVSRMSAHGAGTGVTAGLFRVSLNTGALDYARAVLARWGRPAQPAPPAEGEVAELVAWLRGANWDRQRQTLASRAAELLAQARPTPVSQGHPTNADCDRGGRCWWFDPHNGGAWYYDTFQRTFSHWRPAGAMPRPGLNTEAPE